MKASYCPTPLSLPYSIPAAGAAANAKKCALEKCQVSFVAFSPTVALCAEASGLLAATPLKTFALPATCIVAILQEMIPSHCDVSSIKIGDAVGREQHAPCEGSATDASASELSGEGADRESASPQQAEMYRLQQTQQQELSVLEKKQQVLTKNIREGHVFWSEIAANPVTMLEVQRLFLRLVELKMPPMIATFLSLKQQVEGFLRLLSAAASVVYRADQRQLQQQLQEILPKHGLRKVQELRQSPVQDDSPTAQSDTSVATTATGLGETAKCFWSGFCGSTLARQLCDAPLRVEEHSPSEDSETESSESDAVDEASVKPSNEEKTVANT
ncbi:hypothetical protein Emag_005738 [Eimeria magna]